ncbi:hypothetical protein B5X24_HaOG204915 [Helicoverpa armigera]|uniref:Uncharacterized protein n=1 Tax=Helicoverpa armigera TaxID=29058 RepID=A0A2W1BPG1_HELAM|nr:hypothetical protein B5X24_HaOG204915 [Helicoverpa armigera]
MPGALAWTWSWQRRQGTARPMPRSPTSIDVARPHRLASAAAEARRELQAAERA